MPGFDDVSFDDFISGWSLVATLQPRTPLSWLRRSGEFCAGSKCPSEALPQEHACWVPVPKSWAELGIDLPEMPLGSAATSVGQVKDGGAEFLKFLLRYREIGETGTDIGSQMAAFHVLAADYPEFTTGLGGDLGRLWFSEKLQSDLTIGPALASRLYDGGMQTEAMVHAASDAALLALPHIGRATLAKLRAVRPP